MTGGKLSGPRPEYAATMPATRDIERRLLVMIPDRSVPDAAAILRQEVLDRRDLKILGIKESAQTLRNWEKAGRFPKRSYLSRTRPVWPTREVVPWLGDLLRPVGIQPPVGGGKRPKSSYRKRKAAPDVTAAK